MFAYNKKYRIDFNNKFIDTYRFSPVLHGDVPREGDSFHIPIEQFDPSMLENCIVDHIWWQEQKNRCYLGYTVPKAREDGSDVTITGRHYFYLNFWWIFSKNQDTGIKILQHPKFLDLDYQQAWEWQTCFAIQKDSLAMKARQKGYSEKVAGMMLGWNYTFLPDSLNIVVAGQQTDADHTFSNTKRGLDKLINTQFYKTRRRGGDSSEYLESKYFGSKLYSITAKNNPQALSRYSPTLSVYEEIGKWEKDLSKELKGFVQPSIESEGSKTGWQIFIGTSGNMEAGAADLEYYYENAIDENILDFQDTNEPDADIIPGRRVGGFISRNLYQIIDKDGNSLLEESKAYHKLKEKAAARKSDVDLYLYKVNNPEYASDAFAMTGGGFFDKKIVAVANEQRKLIRLNKEAKIVREGHWDFLDENNWSAGSKFVDGPNEHGVITSHMIEGPDEVLKTKSAYGGSIDSYDRDESQTSDSRGSMSIMKGFVPNSEFSDTWVCRLFFRPEMMTGGAKTFYKETIKVAVAYGLIERTLIEYSNLRIFDYYETNNVELLLQPRPDFIIANMIGNSKVVNKYGIDPASKPHWLSKLNDYLLGEDGDCNPVRKILDPYILDRIIRFKYNPGKGKYNDDTIITMALNIVQREEQVLGYVENQNKAERDKFFLSTRYKRFNPNYR
jgi:hypothetical protein